MMMVMASDEWKDDVFKKIHYIYKDDEKTFGRVLFYLNVEEKAHNGNLSPDWRSLKNSINLETTFKTYVELLADKVKKAQKDEELIEIMMEWKKKVYEKLAALYKDDADTHAKILFYLGEEEKGYKNKMPPSLEILTNLMNSEAAFKRYVDCLADETKVDTGLNFLVREGLIRLIQKLKANPELKGDSILKFGKKYLPNKQLKKLAAGLTFARRALDRVPLTGVILSYDAVQNIYYWWNGDLSGSSCTKNVIYSFSTTAAGVGGAAAGGFLGPVGAFAGGIVVDYLISHSSQNPDL